MIYVSNDVHNLIFSGGEAAKFDGGEEALTTEKTESEEVVEDLCETVADNVNPPAAEQEAGVAN